MNSCMKREPINTVPLPCKNTEIQIDNTLIVFIHMHIVFMRPSLSFSLS